MRLFIAINLPEEAKNTIKEALEKIKPALSGYNGRFLLPENWHLTITFLGWQPDEALDAILKSVKETAAETEAPEIEFESISYGPLDKTARMVWLVGGKKTSETLANLKTKLEDKLAENGVKFQRENRLYSSHLTLARFPETLTGLKTKLITPLALSFKTKTLDLMESRLKRSGAEYEAVSRFDFKLSLR